MKIADISIIVPIYNAQRYLPRCIESIQKQTLSKIEIIAVNDGSTDDCINIIKKKSNKDNRIFLIDKKNGGYGSAINAGLQVAQGQYVGIVEADDWIAPEMFEKLYTKAIATNADIVKANFFNAFSEKDFYPEPSFNWLNPPKNLFSAVDYPYILEFKPTVWSAIYKTSFLKQYNIQMLETPGASFQDLPFTFEVLSLAKIISLLPEPLYYYYQENPTSSVRNINDPFLIFSLFDRIDEFLIEHVELEKKLRRMRFRVQYCHSLWNYARIKKKYRKQFFRKLHKIFRNLDDDVISFIQFTSIDKILMEKIIKNKYHQFNAYNFARTSPIVSKIAAIIGIKGR